MKRAILTIMFAVAMLGIASAQKYCVIDSEKVFKSLNEYNLAMTQLDELGKTYQAEVDKKYEEIESLYNNYMAQRASLSESTRAVIESQILQKEEEAKRYQQQIFGENGTLMKARVDLIKPIQQKVFAAIETYARLNGYALVLDKASNASILFCNGAIDETHRVIEELKK